MDLDVRERERGVGQGVPPLGVNRLPIPALFTAGR